MYNNTCSHYSLIKFSSFSGVEIHLQKMALITAALILIIPFAPVSSTDCSKLEYESCAKMADPLLKEVHLVFPDNADDIDVVCRTWNGFVDCLKRYTEKCFNEQERRQFNQAVENPIESVHQMCMQPAYQQGDYF